MHRRARHLPFSLGSGTNGAKLVLYTPAMRGYADGDLVGSWNDLSGEGNNATASGVDRPTYKSDYQGGMPVVQYTQSNDKSLRLNSYIGVRTLFIVLNQVYAATSYAPFLLGSTDFYEFHRGRLGSLFEPGLVPLGLTNGTTRINGGALFNAFSLDLPLTPLVLTITTTSSVVANTLSKDRTYGRSWTGWYSLIISYDIALGDAGAMSKRIQQSAGVTFRIATK